MEPHKSNPKLHKIIADFFHRWKLEPDKGILIAVSGGIDSTALMALLSGYRDEYFPDLQLHGLYVNHNLRIEEEIETDWNTVSTAADTCSVILHRADIPKGCIAGLAAEHHEGIESAARRSRYEALESWTKKLGLGYIALGHTLDDLLETMLMRFFQGCDVSGLHGIPPVRGNRIRPLIETSKEELKQVVESLGLPVSEDSSNREDWYLRNRIRSGIIPAVKKEFPSLAESLKKSASLFRQEEAVLQHESGRRLRWTRGEKQAEIDYSRFFSAPDVLRIRSLLSLIHHYMPGTARIPRHFLSIKDTPKNRKEAVLLRGHGFTLRKLDKRLLFIPSVVFPVKTRYVKRIFRGCNGTFDKFRYTWGSHQPDTKSGTFITIPEGLSERSIVLRSRRFSDSIRTPAGTKRLKDLYRELGVSEDSRDEIPVLQIGAEIAAVFGSLCGYRDILAEGFQQHSPSTGDVLSIQGMEIRIER